MWPVFIEKLNCKPYEIISVPRYHATFLNSRILHLLKIVNLDHPHLMSTYGIDPVFSQQLGDNWAQIFIEIIFYHGLPAPEEGIFFLDSLWGPLFVLRDKRVYFFRVERVVADCRPDLLFREPVVSLL